jgi:hypothetical protein
LVAISGSGTEAVQSFYDIANAFLTAHGAFEAGDKAGESAPVTNAELLFFRGGYVGSMAIELRDVGMSPSF